MSTRSLLHWLALVAGAELFVRGHLFDRGSWLHMGAWLLSTALALFAFSLRGRRRAAAALACLALIPASLSVLRAIDPNGDAAIPDPRLAFWQAYATERRLLDMGTAGGAPEVELFGLPIALGPRGARAHASASGSHYRIVTVGGSSTFGATQSREEQPWPELLEIAIRRELSCAVPIEVVNAGVLGRGLAGVVKTFEAEVLPLDPQLLLVDPGPGELDALASEFPVLRVAAYASTPARASRPLRRLEESWRQRTTKSAWDDARAKRPTNIDARATTLAGAYRRLLLDARRHGIEVVLSSLVLAISADAPQQEIRRHEALEPRTRQRLLALDLHRRVLAQLAATYRATLLDAPAGPDGAGQDLFLDLHLRSEPGREQLAQNLLDGLRTKLGDEIPGCSARQP